jgi:hypothetical protein
MPVLPVTRPYEKFAQAAKVFIDSKYGLVPVANQYAWWSAAWFESNARSGFVKSVYSFKTDRLKVPDDF